jgi:hypothetical protein
MAGTTISGGNTAGSVSGTEKIPVSGSGNPVITVDLIKAYIETALSSWQTWTITFGGFSSPPTYTARYCVLGKLLFLQMNCTVNGTSNATNFTVSLPGSYVAKTGVIQTMVGVSVVNGGSGVTTNARIVTASGSATLTLALDAIGNVWTNSAGKRASFSGFIEID